MRGLSTISGKAWRPTSEQHQGWLQQTTPARATVLTGIVVSLFVAGTLAGAHLAWSGYQAASRTHHAVGACTALEMAAAYGYLDETAKKVVVRSLASVQNPNAPQFPDRHSDLVAICRYVRASAR